MNETATNKTVYDKPYEVRDTSTIFFGKFKGQPHSVLLDPKNKAYVDWILDTEDNFAESTKVYLRNKSSPLVPNESIV